MAAVVSNPNDSVVFVRNAQDISITGVTADVTVRLGSYLVGTFTPNSSNALTLPLKEMLSAYPHAGLHPGSDVLINQFGIIMLSLSGGVSYSWSFLCVPGGVSGDEHDALAEILTPGPQVQPVCPWSRLFVSLYGITNSTTVTNLKADIYCRLAGKQTVTLRERNNGCVTVALTIQSILAILEEQDAIEEGDTVLAVDVYMETVTSAATEEGTESTTENSHPIRFIFHQSKSNFREFFFRNRLGVIDQVHSRGELAYEPEHEHKIFANRGVYGEAGADANHWRSVNTGLFRSVEEQHQWEDFFLSDEHYMMDQDGTIRKIVLEETDLKAVARDPGSATFKFRYAEEDPGRTINRETLDEFDYDTEIL